MKKPIEISEMQFFKLAEGTPDERWVPPFKEGEGHTLGGQWDKTFPTLIKMLEQIAENARRAAALRQQFFDPAGVIISALFIFWSYTSFDIRRLRTEIMQLNTLLDTKTKNYDALQGEVADLRQRLEELQKTVSTLAGGGAL